MAHDWGDRPRAPFVGTEREVLDGWLDFHRATLLMKCEGLSFEELKRPAVATSSLTLLGLVRHLTDVERGWFLPFLGEDPTPLYGTDDEPTAFAGVPDADAAGDLARFGETIDAINDLLRHRDLDEVEVDGGDAFSLRWIYTHMIEEYARHNGHADLLREAIDGSTGE